MNFINPVEVKLKKILEKRKSQGAFRQLSHNNGLIDFSSNDYLGFARSFELKEKIAEAIEKDKSRLTGSTGSRLLTGNSEVAEEIERDIASFHNAESGLIFNSGYDLNLGLFSCVPQRGDSIFYDQLIHASIRDGIRLSLAKNYSFAHNDVDSLQQKMKNTSGNIFVVVESVYSMDGDFAPLEDLVKICQETGAALVVDEAHATGIFGSRGEGRIFELGLREKVFASIHTFGKALGTHGAIVLGSSVLRDYLINFSRSLIYTTALPLHSLYSIQCAYVFLKKSPDVIKKLHQNVSLFSNMIKEFKSKSFLHSMSPIQGLIIPGNDRVKQTATDLQKRGFDIRPILSPTVPKGKERLRICLHAHNSTENIQYLFKSLRSINVLSG